MTETERIRWIAVDGTVISWFGHVGSAQPALFQILHPVSSTTGSPRFHEWALCAAFPGAENEVRYGGTGPDAAPALKAEAERWLEEFISSLGASFPDGPAQEHKLPLIGRDLVLVRNLAKQIADKGVRGHALTPLSVRGMDGRGFTFEVLIREDRVDTGRIAKVTVALDRVDEDAHGHD